MIEKSRDPGRWRNVRFTWALLSLFVVESVVFGLSVLPATLFWQWHFRWTYPAEWIRIVLLAMSFVPAYLLFALSLMALTALAMRLFGWRTPANAEMSIVDVGWPLLKWARYSVATHIVRVFAGTLFRSTAVWTLFMRLNGARIGKGVYVNSISLMDHNLLQLDDYVVVGSDVHMSGHTAEAGVVKTAEVHLHRGVMLGVGSVVGIGVEIGEGAQIGSLTVVPKFKRIEPGAVYVGATFRRLDREDARDS